MKILVIILVTDAECFSAQNPNGTAPTVGVVMFKMWLNTYGKQWKRYNKEYGFVFEEPGNL